MTPPLPSVFTGPGQHIGISLARRFIAASANGFGRMADIPMYRAFARVTNFGSPQDSLDFGSFTLRQVDVRNLDTFREALKSSDVMQGDWVYQREYLEPPPGPPSAVAGFGAIPQDTEDIMFLLRIYKIGDVNFSKQVIFKPDGTAFRQHPYRLMNDLNTESPIETVITQEDAPHSSPLLMVSTRAKAGRPAGFKWHDDSFCTAMETSSFRNGTTVIES